MHFLYGLSRDDKKSLAEKCLKMFSDDLDDEDNQIELIKAARQAFGPEPFVPPVEVTRSAIGPDDMQALSQLGYDIVLDSQNLSYLRDSTERLYYEVFKSLYAQDKALALRVLKVLTNHNGLYLPIYVIHKDELER